MASGYDDGDEPWLRPGPYTGNNPDDPFWKLPVKERESIWWEALQTPDRKGGIHEENRHPDLPKLDMRQPDNQLVRDDCFVATATYQNPNAPQVDNYRWLRDNVLDRFETGRWFTKTYYNGLGGTLAEIVENHPSLRIVSRGALDLGSMVIGYARKQTDNGQQNTE